MDFSLFLNTVPLLIWAEMRWGSLIPHWGNGEGIERIIQAAEKKKKLTRNSEKGSPAQATHNLWRWGTDPSLHLLSHPLSEKCGNRELKVVGSWGQILRPSFPEIKGSGILFTAKEVRFITWITTPVLYCWVTYWHVGHWELVILIAVPQLASCRGRSRWVSTAEACQHLLSSSTTLHVSKCARRLIHHLDDESVEALVFKSINSK